MARASKSLACSLLLALCACRDNTVGPAHYSLAVQTDKVAYSLAADSNATITITNHSDRSVFLPMDRYVVYERLVDGQWVDGYAWFVVDGVGRSFPLAPGESLSNELELWFYLTGQPGTYRLRYFVYTDPDVHHLLPLAERISSPFTLAP